MPELVLKIDDQLATRLSIVAQEHYDGGPNAVVSDALRLLFLQPIRKDRRKIARLIDEMRVQVQAAGGVTEKKIDRLIRRLSKKTQNKILKVWLTEKNSHGKNIFVLSFP